VKIRSCVTVCVQNATCTITKVKVGYRYVVPRNTHAHTTRYVRTWSCAHVWDKPRYQKRKLKYYWLGVCNQGIRLPGRKADRTDNRQAANARRNATSSRIFRPRYSKNRHQGALLELDPRAPGTTLFASIFVLNSIWA